MRRILVVVILTAVGGLAGAAENVLTAGDAKAFGQLLAARRDKGGVVVVELSAPWCVACKKLDPELDRLAEINPQLSVIRVDTDQVPAVGKRFDATSLPLLIKFDKGGEQRESGFANGEVLAKWLGVSNKKK